MRRSTRNRTEESTPVKKNEIVDIEIPNNLAATDSMVKLRVDSDDEMSDEKPPIRRSRRNSVKQTNSRVTPPPKSVAGKVRKTKNNDKIPRKPGRPRKSETEKKHPKKQVSRRVGRPALAERNRGRSVTKETVKVENSSSSSDNSSDEKQPISVKMEEDAESVTSGSSSTEKDSDEERRMSDYSGSDSEEDEDVEADKSDEEDVMEVDEPSSDEERPKRRSRSAKPPRTPNAKRHELHRRAAKAVKPLPAPAIESLNDTIDKDARSLSRALLHVGATPGYLPCREDEYLMIEGCIESLLEDGQGGCVYISGTPGTGKTATVHSVIRGLIERSNNMEITPFKYVEINGLRVSEPARAYPILWDGLKGDQMSLSPKAALNALENYYAKGSNDEACVLLMDELDQMVTNKQSEVYNFFNWPNMPRSKLIVIAVANTMDLPERVLRGKVKSRLGMERINFAPYDRMQLIEIVQSRLRYAVSLADGKDYTHLTDEDTRGIFDEDAVKIAAAKTASVQGDARRMLEVCRQTLERAVTLPVKTSHVQQTLKAMSLSPLSRLMSSLSLSAKIMLVSTMRCAIAAGMGTGECKWGDVSNLHSKLSAQIIPYNPPIALSKTDQYAVLSALAATRIVLAHEPGASNTGLNKGSDAERMLILNIPEADVRRVLGEDARFQSVLG